MESLHTSKLDKLGYVSIWARPDSTTSVVASGSVKLINNPEYKINVTVFKNEDGLSLSLSHRNVENESWVKLGNIPVKPNTSGKSKFIASGKGTVEGLGDVVVFLFDNERANSDRSPTYTGTISVDSQGRQQKGKPVVTTQSVGDTF